MTETLLALIPQYGVWILGAGTFLSCLAVPMPSSLMMLAAGGFVASGEMLAWQALSAAYAGAVLGDQAGFAAGRAGGRALIGRIGRAPRRRRLFEGAARYLQNRGTPAVFFSRWLVSPLGPYVNFAGGAAGLARTRFTLASAAGEAVWVTGYTGLGFLSANNIAALSDILSNASGFLAGLATIAALGYWLRAALRQRHPS